MKHSVEDFYTLGTFEEYDCYVLISIKYIIEWFQYFQSQSDLEDKCYKKVLWSVRGCVRARSVPRGDYTLQQSVTQ